MCGCFLANSISELVNGSPTNEFEGMWGLKQGDPLAPFLLIITTEGLASLMQKAEEANHFKGFSVNETLSTSLLQFADDAVIVYDGGERRTFGVLRLSCEALNYLQL